MWSLPHPLQKGSGWLRPSDHLHWTGSLENSPIWEMINRACSGDGSSMADWAGCDWGGAWYQTLQGSGYEERGKQASMRDHGHPPTLLTEGHALDVLSIRKMCPFPRWISAHLCPKTVPHAFLCMWTWQSSANHQQDVSFVFPMWWAIPTFTHFLVRTEPLHGWSGLGMLL